MIFLAVGCSYHNSPVGVRERLAFGDDGLARALEAINRRFDCEAVILSTCNRVELYVARVADQGEFKGEDVAIWSESAAAPRTQAARRRA